MPPSTELEPPVDLGSGVIVPKRRRAVTKVVVVRLLGMIALAAALGYVVWRGWTFYRLSIDARPDHPDFRKLRPSGLVGQGYGVAATALVLLNLAYLIRRRFAGSSMGSMRAWLDLHVFTGLLAGVFACAHSALQARTPLAKVTGGSLVVVIVSGVIGRWIYALTSRSKVSLSALIGMVEMYCPGFAGDVRAALAKVPVPKAPLHVSLFRAIALLAPSRAIARARRAAVEEVSAVHLEALSISPPRRREIAGHMAEAAKEAAAEARAVAVNALLRSWRGLHRLFALIMIVTVVVHIGVAWYFGYRWVFSK